MRPELLDVTAKHPGIIFTPFTNGLLVNDEHIRKLKKQPNVIPIVSFEGYEFQTDQAADKVCMKMAWLCWKSSKLQNLYYGVSITTTRKISKQSAMGIYFSAWWNWDAAFSSSSTSSRLKKGSESLVMTQDQVDG